MKPLSMVFAALLIGLLTIRVTAQDIVLPAQDVVLPAQEVVLPAQDVVLPAQGGALIIEGHRAEPGAGLVNPLLCSSQRCRRLGALLFPALLHVADHGGLTNPAGTLAESWSQDGAALTVRLHPDRRWSDGRPVTAYDVAFSTLAAEVTGPYAGAVQRAIAAVTVLDAATIQFTLNAATCSAAAAVALPVLPAHAFDPDFAVRVDDGTARDWLAAQSGAYRTHPFNVTAPITGGLFEPPQRQLAASVDLLTTDRANAYRSVDVPNAQAAVDALLADDLNLIVNPPYNRWRDLRAAADVRTLTEPGAVAFLILLDHRANDEAVGPHPVFGTPDVRRAFQLALDVPALLDVLVDGEGVVVASPSAPAQLAYDPARVPVGYDPVEAGRLLREAGWRDTDGDGFRDCSGCANGQPGQRLTFTIGWVVDGAYENRLFRLLEAVQRQFRAVGADARLLDGSAAVNQSRDAWLIDTGTLAQEGVGIADLFTTDRPFNIGAYTNPAVDAAFAQADQPPSCSAIDQRRTLAQQAETILIAEQAALWLFAPNRLIAVRDGIDRAGVLWELLTR